jgi:tetratricopeptide (TPR) repeat protein
MKRLILSLCLCTAVSGSAQTGPPLLGSLRLGPYAVGFQSRYEFDETRVYDSEYLLAEKPQPKNPRPIFIGIWYPAAQQAGARMVFRDYLKPLSATSRMPEFAQRLRVHSRNMMCLYMLRKEFRSLNPQEHAAFETFLSTTTSAVLDAPPAAGKFPVVIYHPGLGGTYEDNSVLFEYLASYGYVVFSSAYQAADSTFLNINGDYHTSFQDLNYLSHIATTLPFADASRLGAMGHSYGGCAVLAWRAQPGSALNAVVSIDSTVEYVDLDAPNLRDVKALFIVNQKSTTPTIRFADPKRNPRFETLDAYLAYAPRYEVTVNGQEHSDFTSQGMLGRELLATVGGDPGTAALSRRNYDEIDTRILHFLDAYLKRENAALELLAAGNIHYKAPQPLTPTGAQLVRLYDHHALDNLPGLEEEVFEAAAMILMDGSRRDDAVKLLSLGTEKFPNSASLQQMLGDCLRMARDPAKAAEAYRRALRLIDSDVTLKEEERIEAKKEISESLQSLARRESKGAP